MSTPSLLSAPVQPGDLVPSAGWNNFPKGRVADKTDSTLSAVSNAEAIMAGLTTVMFNVTNDRAYQVRGSVCVSASSIPARTGVRVRCRLDGLTGQVLAGAMLTIEGPGFSTFTLGGAVVTLGTGSHVLVVTALIDSGGGSLAVPVAANWIAIADVGPAVPADFSRPADPVPEPTPKDRTRL